MTDEVIYSICDCNDNNNTNIGDSMFWFSLILGIVGFLVIGIVAYLGMKATGAL